MSNQITRILTGKRDVEAKHSDMPLETENRTH